MKKLLVFFCAIVIFTACGTNNKKIVKLEQLPYDLIFDTLVVEKDTFLLLREKGSVRIVGFTKNNKL